MLVVTAGSSYLDIDSYACCIAYAELLREQGKDAKAISTAILNESITPSLRELNVQIETEYTDSPNDQYILVDISDPVHFDTIVTPARIIEIFDHHPGFEEYWANVPGVRPHIDFIGAAATLIFEQWANAGLVAKMSNASAQLLAAAILDNTLNFKATITTPRDSNAYAVLAQHVALDDTWVTQYFSECQSTILRDLPSALQNDTKTATYTSFPQSMKVGQLVVWDGQAIIGKTLPTLTAIMSKTSDKPWYINVVDISEGRSYFVTEDNQIKQWLGNLLGVTFNKEVATAERLWLRKEIMKASQQHQHM